MPKNATVWIIIFLLLVACSTAEPETIVVQETVIAEVPVTVEVTRQIMVETTVAVTQEVEVTREVDVTRLVEVTVEVPVTVTPTPTPINTPTPSNTPTITPTPSNTPTLTPSATPTQTPTPTPTVTPSPTPNLAATATIEAYGVLAAPKRDGFHTVGQEILPGKWRSTGSGRGCYWARLDGNQDLLDNHFGLAGGTVNIRTSDAEVEFEDCGRWIYVEDEVPVLQDGATAPKGDGFYTVGVEIAPGRWESTGTGDSCYWSRLNGNQGILDNHFGNAGGTVTIRASDYEVLFEDCGTWEYVSP